MSNKTVTGLDDQDQVAATKTNEAVVKPKFNINDKDMSGDMVTLTIAHGEGVLGKQAVFLNVNATPVHIPRGVKVEIPIELKMALDDAETEVQEYDEASGTVQSRAVKRFNYTIHSITPKAAEKKAK